MDNFKGQITAKVNGLLESNCIHVCLLPAKHHRPSATTANKPAKEFLRQKFQEWYSKKKIREQVGEESDINTVEINPVNMSVPVLKEVGVNWFVQMAKYIGDNAEFLTCIWVQESWKCRSFGWY